MRRASSNVLGSPVSPLRSLRRLQSRVSETRATPLLFLAFKRPVSSVAIERENVVLKNDKRRVNPRKNNKNGVVSGSKDQNMYEFFLGYERILN